MKTIYPFPVNYDSVNGVSIASTDSEKGKPILFIHGLAGYMPLWQFQISELTADHRCAALDLPGNGLSKPCTGKYSMLGYAETVAAYIQENKIAPVILCGHSMGGQIAMLVALRYPHLVEKLVLIAPAGFEYFTEPEKQMFSHALDMGQIWGIHNNYLDQFIHWSFYKPNPLADSISKDLYNLASGDNMKEWHRMITESTKAMLSESVSMHLENISQPVLIIFGENDALIPNKIIHFQETTRGVAYKGAALIPNADLHMIPQAGHFVQLEKFQIVNNLIRDFARE